MASLATSSVRLLVIMTIAMVCVNVMVVNGQCEGDIPSLISQCAKYVRKTGKQTAPSSQCCEVLKNANIPCLCMYVTKDVEQYVSVQKAIYVVQYCGVALQHGSKCGSYTIPGN